VQSGKPASNRKYHIVMLGSVLAALGAVAFLAAHPLPGLPGWPVTMPDATSEHGASNASDMTEAMPVAGANAILTLAELRYCEFERERIDHLRPMITEDVRTRFNAAVGAFNAVCIDRVYWDSDMARVMTERAVRRVAIDGQAEDVLANWARQAVAAAAALPTLSLPSISPTSSAQASAPPTSSSSTPQPAPAEPRREVASGVLFDIATTSGATDVQAELQSRGFYQGKVDGHWGAQSQAALMAWKVSAGLAPDAIWDRPTERALMGE
jgi:hypothetical protein